MYYLYVKNGRFVTVIVSHRGVCFADICPRPHRVSVDTGQASRCPLKRPVTVRLEVVQKPPFSYYSLRGRHQSARQQLLTLPMLGVMVS